MVREQAFPVETANSVPALVEFFLDHNLGKARTDYVKSECACKCGALARVDGIGADCRLFPLSSLPAPPSVPTPTYSCHWVRHSHFKQIVSNFLDEEQRQIDYTLEVLEQELSPYKQPAG